MTETVKTADPKDAPFAAFCRDLIGTDDASLSSWNRKVGHGRGRNLLTAWCDGYELPTRETVYLLHRAIMQDHGLSHAIRERWLSVLREQQVPKDGTLAFMLQEEMHARLSHCLHRLDLPLRFGLLERFAEHAETLSHYHKRRT